MTTKIMSARRSWRNLTLCLLASPLLALGIGSAQAQYVASPTAAQVFNGGNVSAVVRQSDGKVIIGGTFTAINGVTRNRIARLNADGSLDATWNPDADSTVNALALDGSGNVYAGGLFTTIGGQSRNRIAKLSGIGAGAADATWNPDSNGSVSALALDGSGNIYAGGDFTSIGGQVRNRIAMLSTSGTGVADATWNPNANSTVRSVAVDGSGNIYAAGTFGIIGGQSRAGIVRLSTSGVGAVDATWNPNANSGTLALALDGSGNIYAGGGFTSIGGQSRNRIAKLSTSGTGAADATWDPNSNNNVSALALDGSGNIYAGGDFTTIGGQSRNRIARLSTSGTGAVDATWNPDANTTVSAIAPDGSGNVHAGGSFATIGGQTRGGFATITSAGAADTAWSAAQTAGTVSAIARDSAGRIIVGGTFTMVGDGTARNRIARFNADESVDSTWNPNSSGNVTALAINSSGDVYAGGSFAIIGGQSRNRIAKLDGTTGLATAWDANANSPVGVLAIDGSGNIYAGGSFTSIGGQSRNRVAMLDGATGLATAWNPNASSNVNAIAFDGSGNLYVGGSFTTIGGQARNRIAMLDAATGLAGAWNPNANNAVNAIAFDGSGGIYAGGSFTTIGGQTRNRIAMLDSATGLASTWDPNAGGNVNVLTLDGNGNIYAGGAFTTVGGQTRNRIAKLSLSGTGAADPGWDANAGGNVSALVVDGSSVHAGGPFTSLAGQSQLGYARLLPQSVPDAPTAASAAAGAAQATVTFAAPAMNGGSAITGYTVTSSPAGGIDSNAGSTSLSHLITGLTNGTPYTFIVTATNAIGTSAASAASNSVTPSTVPTATTAAAGSITTTGAILNGSINDNGASTAVSFDYGLTTGYGSNVAATTGATVAANAGSTAVAVTLSGLTCNTTYHFRVNGVNSAGTTNGGDLNFTTSACPTYSVTYNGNTHTGGSVPVDAASYLTGATVTALANTGPLVKTNYAFAGWNTAADGSGTGQAATSTFAMGAANVTLYAQWTLTSINGVCGSTHGTTVAFAPSANLCSAGSASGVTASSGAYGWTCAGSNGGTTAVCSASGQSTGSGAGTATVATNGWVFAPQGNGPLQSAGFIPVSGHPKSPPDLPPGVSFPFGLYDFVLSGGTAGSSAVITITYPSAIPAGAVYWKYGPTPAGYNCAGVACATPHWYQFPAVLAGNTATLTIVDGGVGDDDLVANGTIVDQGGPGLGAAAGIPTLSEWARMLLAGMLAMFGMVAVRRRNRCSFR